MSISVCIATYNGGAFIKDQIYSILLQLSQNDEIIISDDGSRDSTLNILFLLMTLGLRFIKMGENMV